MLSRRLCKTKKLSPGRSQQAATLLCLFSTQYTHKTPFGRRVAPRCDRAGVRKPIGLTSRCKLSTLTSYLLPLTSYLLLLTSYFLPLTSYLLPLTSYLRIFLVATLPLRSMARTMYIPRASSDTLSVFSPRTSATIAPEVEYTLMRATSAPATLTSRPL